MKSISKASYLAALVIACVVLTISAQAQSWITNGLVAYYPFDGSPDDATGNSRNGVINNTTYATNRFGAINSAIAFNGINSFFEATNFPQMLNSSTYTVWIKINGNAQDSNQSFGTMGSVAQWNNCYNMSGFWGLSEIRNNTWEVPEGTNSPKFNWVMVGVVFDPSGIEYCYINGQMLATRNVDLPLSTPGNNKFYIGSLYGGVGQFLNGYIDDARPPFLSS